LRIKHRCRHGRTKPQLATPSERPPKPPQEPAKELSFSVAISVMTTKFEAAKCGDRAGAVGAIDEATSCGVDDATIVVFLLEMSSKENE
jgi:hypothetical protein